MSNLILAAFATIAFTTMTFAQEQLNTRHGLGYLFYEAGAVTNTYNTGHFQGAGGGGEFLFRNGLGLGAELAGHSTALASFSVNPYFHFNQASQGSKWIPFVTAGYTVAGNIESAEKWFNFGGGVDYWPTERIGARLELRDAVDTNHSRPIHQVGFRVGLAWR